MAILDHISLFDYLTNEKELARLDSHKDLQVSSPEALALLTALSYHDSPRKMFFLFPTIYEAESFSDFLGDYVKEDEMFFFPYDEIFRNSAIGASPEMNEERLLAISSVFSDKPSILIAHLSSYSINILPKERYREKTIDIKKGDLLDISSFLLSLANIGYMSVDRVTSASQFAKRGGIIDIYDACYDNPIRIEFFGDEIDDIRFFNANDELSFTHVKEITIHPASLRIFTKEEQVSALELIDRELATAKKKCKDRLSLDDLEERMNNLKNSSSSLFLGDINARFYPLFEKDDITLADYLSDYEKYAFEPKTILDESKAISDKETEYFEGCFKNGISLESERVYSLKKTDLNSFSTAKSGTDEFLLRENSFKAISYAESKDMLHNYIDEGYRIRIILPEPNYSNYLNYLTDSEVDYTIYPKHSEIMLLEGKIAHGFEIPSRKHVYLSAKEIFGISDQRSRFLSRYKEAKIIRRYEDLKVGDYVVHEVNGVGRYLGVTTLDGLEYLKIQYANESLFYLPLSQYRLIRKFSSREGYTPSLDKMGGSTWSRKKSKIRSKIAFLADQLLALYSERKTRPGFAFPQEEELEKEFMDAFPYPYTQGQLKVIQDIKTDMESPYPMDRLLAGDVGFGKTEIAFVAAFKAMLAHKQVALLCPTTILCMQHFKVAAERFKSFGIRICAFSRFVPASQQKTNIQLIKEGKIDFVIGTHRLLSNDIVFKDLGLLIVDEEQKFGVTHKEKIKEKSKNIDCLTLTATPIPRTLQMSLLNVRSLSLLEQAPINRMPVKTYVAKQDKELIYEVIGKELERKGQVYYLHNDIKSIYFLASSIQKKFPSHHVGVCHARMSEDEIEETMSNFYACEYDILVCTSIIESGLDIPNVNTIIVENADHFGLSQLYQIKGRVGRSSRLAYAYFFFKDANKITPDAKKRLKALKDFTELGSGYKIAMQDLNIRGAGDILGSEQAGFVDTLGYDAYVDLLKEVVKEKEVMNNAVIEKKDEHRFELSFSLDAHIPEEYGSETQRINMYRELSDCESDNDLNAFSKKLRDVYGTYPEEVSNLLIKRKIEISLNSGLYDNFIEGLGVYTITMTTAFSAKPALYKVLEEKLQPLLVKLRVHINDHRFEFSLIKSRDYLTDLLFLTGELEKADRA